MVDCLLVEDVQKDGLGCGFHRRIQCSSSRFQRVARWISRAIGPLHHLNDMRYAVLDDETEQKNVTRQSLA